MTVFRVPGCPMPKGSMRAFVHGGRAVMTNADPRTGKWQKRVSAEAVKAFELREPHLGAVTVEVEFRLPRPASVNERRRPLPCVKPDADKLIRVILDALTGVAYEDDGQVVEIHIRKRYTEPGYECAWVRVEAA